jgi:hypothetical protein
MMDLGNQQLNWIITNGRISRVFNRLKSIRRFFKNLFFIASVTLLIYHKTKRKNVNYEGFFRVTFLR